MSRAWSRTNIRKECLIRARRLNQGPNRRLKYEYQWNICKEWFSEGEVQVDHIVPKGSYLTYEDWAGWGARLCCPVEGLQCLCKPCHNTKTKIDNAETRRKPSTI